MIKERNELQKLEKENMRRRKTEKQRRYNYLKMSYRNFD